MAEGTLRLLLDTDVLLDVLLDRRPWAEDAAALLDAIAGGRAQGFMAGHAVTTIHYLVQKGASRPRAATAVGDLLALLEVAAVDRATLQRALALGLADFEDGVQAAACLEMGCDYLVTRNPRDFKGAPVVTRTPGEVLPLLDR